MSWQGIEVVQVVAIDQQRCIGKNNTLPWHVSDDLKHFKNLTQNGIVVMGRKNFDSIGRPLPNRSNIVITRQNNWQVDGVQVVHGLEVALDLAATLAQEHQQGQLFVIGGAEIFTHALPYTDRIEMTHLELDVPDGDVFYPILPESFDCINSRMHTDEKSGISMRFATYVRQPD